MGSSIIDIGKIRALMAYKKPYSKRISPDTRKISQCHRAEN